MREESELYAAVQPHPCLPHRGRSRHSPRVTYNSAWLHTATQPTTIITTTTTIPTTLFVPSLC